MNPPFFIPISWCTLHRQLHQRSPQSGRTVATTHPVTGHIMKETVGCWLHSKGSRISHPTALRMDPDGTIRASSENHCSDIIVFDLISLQCTVFHQTNTLLLSEIP
ncbi:hypothetical protein CRM22_001405 [Opisthorchis felineus]|uniref:Uncharacterized protein n=1 Tax=Opisthorchis felineus TaxID=147828 RepID=A0A4S2MGY9_OPIFE|nr:hypothetical protein CRM22_001405 [Opisthorchis felineus]